jgi:hypothetical protein
VHCRSRSIGSTLYIVYAIHIHRQPCPEALADRISQGIASKCSRLGRHMPTRPGRCRVAAERSRLHHTNAFIAAAPASGGAGWTRRSGDRLPTDVDSCSGCAVRVVGLKSWWPRTESRASEAGQAPVKRSLTANCRHLDFQRNGLRVQDDLTTYNAARQGKSDIWVI